MVFRSAQNIFKMMYKIKNHSTKNDYKSHNLAQILFHNQYTHIHPQTPTAYNLTHFSIFSL